MGEKHTASQPQEAAALEAYDAGLLNDFGGGNVEWWQDYIRAELGRAHDFYQSQIASSRSQALPAVPDGWKEAAIAWTVCASIHEKYAKGKDALFTTRQSDFLRHAAAAGAMIAAAAVPEGWMSQFEELLDDYVGACAETAVFNATQRSGMTVRMAGPRRKALMTHVSAIASLAKAEAK